MVVESGEGAMPMGGATAGCEGDNVPPTLGAKGVQRGTMKMIYSFTDIE